MDASSALLQKGIQSMIAIKEENDIDSLFSVSTTTALSHTINGFGDFEIIGFLVIRPKT